MPIGTKYTLPRRYRARAATAAFIGLPSRHDDALDLVARRRPALPHGPLASVIIGGTAREGTAAG
jgi:hypothetical protein